MGRMETIHALQSFSSPALDLIAQSISDLGSERGYIILLLAIYLGYDAAIGRRVGVYLLLAFTINFHLKELFGTQRPFLVEPDVLRSAEENLGPSFPSGHAQASTVFWGYLASRVGRRWFWILAVVLIALIALTRVYLGVHYPIDVVGGVLIGAALVIGARALDRGVRGVDIAPRLVLGLGLVVPLLANVFIPPPGDESGLLMGALAAFLTAPVLYSHRAPTQLWRKVLLVALGIVIAFVILSLTSVVLPEDAKRHALWGFLRYLALGWSGLLLTPWLGRVLGLAPRSA